MNEDFGSWYYQFDDDTPIVLADCLSEDGKLSLELDGQDGKGGSVEFSSNDKRLKLFYKLPIKKERQLKIREILDD